MKFDKKISLIMKNFKIMIIVILVVMALTACDNSKKIVGQWVTVGGTYFKRIEFFSDGTYSSNKSNYKGNYSIEKNRIKLEGYLMDDKIYNFEIDGDKLILYKGDSIEKGDEYERVLN